MDWGTLIAVAGTLSGIVLGNRLTTRAQLEAEVRARRETMYVEWVKFLNGLPDQAMDALIEGNAEGTFRREVSRRLNEVTAEISVFASDEVREAWNAYREKIGSAEFRARVAEVHASSKSMFEFFQHGWGSGLESERLALLAEMRRDLGTQTARRRWSVRSR